ncbi:MAG: NUDIX domain-containing protein [Candidatus Nomurabacteria bacterium]|jgi:8-oxo-dGTP diphosphatase|nr:NUDIX domain-containing protein [Candidatus Nomurabacteria bacterium]
MTAKKQQLEQKKPAQAENKPSGRPSKFDKLRGILKGRRPQIHMIGREPTSGGIIFRPSKKTPGEVEILLIQDVKKRWTIPKGHVEPGEPAKQTAIREIQEEIGLKEMEVLGWLGKTEFKYRRLNKLVLMTMQVYLVRALGDTDDLKSEEWIQGVKWFSFNDALDKIEYDDIGDLMLLAKKRIRQQGLNR